MKMTWCQFFVVTLAMVSQAQRWSQQRGHAVFDSVSQSPELEEEDNFFNKDLCFLAHQYHACLEKSLQILQFKEYFFNQFLDSDIIQAITLLEEYAKPTAQVHKKSQAYVHLALAGLYGQINQQSVSHQHLTLAFQYDNSLTRHLLPMEFSEIIGFLKEAQTLERKLMLRIINIKNTAENFEPVIRLKKAVELYGKGKIATAEKFLKRAEKADATLEDIADAIRTKRIINDKQIDEAIAKKQQARARLIC